jgi:predicted transcriptional regulator
MTNGTNRAPGEPRPFLTEAEIEAKYAPKEGATVAERLAAYGNAFIVQPGIGEFVNAIVDFLRVAGTPLTEAEDAAIGYRRALDAVLRGDQPEANPDSGNKTLKDIKARLKSRAIVKPTTVSELLRWFGVENLDDQMINMIQRELRSNNLRTEPDFTDQYIEGSIEFCEGSRMTVHEARWLDYFHATLIKPRVIREYYPGEPTRAEVWNKYDALMHLTKIEDFSQEEVEAAHVALSVKKFIGNGYEPEIASNLAKTLHQITGSFSSWMSFYTNSIKKTMVEVSFEKIITGPWKTSVPEEIPITTFRVRGLQAANKTVVSVKPTDSITEAIARMQSKNYSKIPVMRTIYEPKRVISCKSIIVHQQQSAMHLVGQAQKYMDTTWSEINADDTLLNAINAIERDHYVLVRERDRRISGIITNSDLSKELRERAEPFILINQIENHIRNLIKQTFTDQEITDNFPEGRYGKKIYNVFELTFDGYITLLRSDKNWAKLQLRTGKNTFIEYLENVAKIRNHFMHFRPDDGALTKRLELLREFLTLLEYVEPMARSEKGSC